MIQGSSENCKMTTVNSAGNHKHLLHWFRKGLRLHDQPSLYKALQECTTFRCIYIIDDTFFPDSNDSINKWRFLLESLQDLDKSLKQLNSRLFVMRGQPSTTIPRLFQEWSITHISFEEDPDLHAKARDERVKEMCREHYVEVVSHTSHTLYDIGRISKETNIENLLTFNDFLALLADLGPPLGSVPSISGATLGATETPLGRNHDKEYGIPTLEQLGFRKPIAKTSVWVGGETEGLKRLRRCLQEREFLMATEKDKFCSLRTAPTDLGPYLRFGCLSVRFLYHEVLTARHYFGIVDVVPSIPKSLLWREYFYCIAAKSENFDKMIENGMCAQIPWTDNPEALAKWTYGKTGFPCIDAIQSQLRQEGWIPEVARRATISFLTRGTLWLSWEKGMKVFEDLLIEADRSTNAGTWMWLSCSSFFHQTMKVYCPVKFGRKMDPHGHYIRKYVPVLRNYPLRYIHEPWTAPHAVQVSANCIVGDSYPLPMINHVEAAEINLEKMRQVQFKLMNVKPMTVS